ncbi:MAG: hypothetical protein DME72_08350 [Verrucomicrobia bacterium]|nr:MAG: hypothetical protein DME72_08350 [Verrucomicrobiota bacterium]
MLLNTSCSAFNPCCARSDVIIANIATGRTKQRIIALHHSYSHASSEVPGERARAHMLVRATSRVDLMMRF